uniref:Uncharacterized protein n=1 Tax=Nelumbo nucifera TaxID=4432 RepID=A0A822XFI5_NELNU|nr:TPA_asm: hypothetical protein HUJ06_020430 [Nelumbo nucifera]
MHYALNNCEFHCCNKTKCGLVGPDLKDGNSMWQRLIESEVDALSGSLATGDNTR